MGSMKHRAALFLPRPSSLPVREDRKERIFQALVENMQKDLQRNDCSFLHRSFSDSCTASSRLYGAPDGRRAAPRHQGTTAPTHQSSRTSDPCGGRHCKLRALPSSATRYVYGRIIKSGPQHWSAPWPPGRLRPVMRQQSITCCDRFH